ncbi:MAG: hypothetical protein KKB21_03465 [Nanoarchaeota archaeon]|nr:hypothetical protein [Nanoarchaeota archaeon]
MPIKGTKPRIARITVIDKQSKSAVYSIVNPLKAALKRKQAGDVPMMIDEQNATVSIPLGLSSREIETMLEHIGVKYELKYEDADTPSQAQSVEVYPQNYGVLRGQAKQLELDNQTLRLVVSGLEQSLTVERGMSNTLRAQVGELKAKFGARDVPDLLTEIMLRENSSWETAARAYNDTLEIAVDVLSTPSEALERECLDYKGVEAREDYQAIAAEFKEAEAAEQLAKTNPRLRLDDYAKSVLIKGRRIIERANIIKDAHDSLAVCFTGKKMRLVATTEDQEVVITLPYKFKEKYAGLEKGLVHAIDDSLTTAKVEYRTEDFNGLLRYRISGLKTRAKNKLLKDIKDCADPFARLCGEREIISVGFY